MNKTFRWSISLLFFLCIFGCNLNDKQQQEQTNQPSDQLQAAADPAHNAITQVATIDALLAGVYDGHMTLETLRTFGDFGIGTFEGLDGEMVLLDGTFYQVKSDGKVYQPGPETQTPFACVIHFSADHILPINKRHNMSSLEALIDSLVPQQNRFVAFRLHGQFNHMRTRSVPAQKKPYPPLAEVTRFQPIFDMHDIPGTLIGFRSPTFVQGVNVPGYHMHFLADDHSGGGHILAFTMLSGKMEMDTVHSWLNLYMPSDSDAFHQADLSVDRSQELHYVEKEN
jgi:acetolactate decarboxylase